ncbi:helix-turn-helix domain-containing protein [Fuchsiella alkaliacetigena]|uniref:helix-turn-helix domain-containing protein n=1 Tax=Fuchsiella alkaliacetigena TaxID=957042 RepID=UPI00200B08E3|nr:XRE family transcriptional regulator [Fuchsiella alkaliacetigena]MCK8824878.1 XRE family transcriptional regulator [Fuchsiella alkaliacetigena]
MNIAKIIGDNLKKIQEEYGYSQKEMGDIIGVTRQTIAKYLNGEQVLDSGKLYQMAKHFNKSIDYFLAPDDEEQKLAFMFRADDPANNFTKKLRNHISKRFNFYHEVINLSDSQIKDYIPEEYNLNLKGSKLSGEEKEVIEEIAEKQRRYMGVDDATGINVFKVFEENNINIVAEDINNSKLEALSAYSKEKGAFIFINDSPNKPEERKVFSVAHELGHLIMHRDEYSKEAEDLKYTNSRIKDIREKAANHFAMTFLVSPKILKRHYNYQLDGFIDLELIYDIKQDFGVSAECLLRALKEYKIIEDGLYGYLRNSLHQEGFKTEEPEPRKYIKKNEKITALVKRLIFEDKITINKAAEVLNLPLLEMRQKAKGWKKVEYLQT